MLGEISDPATMKQCSRNLSAKNLLHMSLWCHFKVLTVAKLVIDERTNHLGAFDVCGSAKFLEWYYDIAGSSLI
jgi:hypothetical protein